MIARRTSHHAQTGRSAHAGPCRSRSGTSVKNGVIAWQYICSANWITVCRSNRSYPSNTTRNSPFDRLVLHQIQKRLITGATGFPRKCGGSASAFACCTARAWYPLSPDREKSFTVST